jgi:hypothetical protein
MNQPELILEKFMVNGDYYGIVISSNHHMVEELLDNLAECYGINETKEVHPR